jgi:hypothetical protein
MLHLCLVFNSNGAYFGAQQLFSVSKFPHTTATTKLKGEIVCSREEMCYVTKVRFMLSYAILEIF